MKLTKAQRLWACKNITVKTAWESLARQIFTDQHGELQREEMRKMFYAAWHDVMSTVMEISEHLSEQEAADKLQELHEETKAEANELRSIALPVYPKDVH